MNNEEKTYLLIMLLKDMRGDWSCNIKNRVSKIIELGQELELGEVVNNANAYLENGDLDGRWFRDSWENGGYEDAPLPNIETFSVELLSEIRNNLNYPEYALPDTISYKTQKVKSEESK